MKAAYNTRLEVVVYKFGDYLSQFYLSIEKVSAICPKLPTFDEQSDVELMEITGDEFNQLQEAHNEEYYKTVSGFYVPRSADLNLVKKLVEAYRMELPVMLEYSKGYEQYSMTNSSSDGLVHTTYLGCSTGPLKTLLTKQKCFDENAQAFSFEGLRSVYVLN